MSKAAFWQRGEAIDYKNAGSDTIEAGTVIVLGARIGVAGMSIDPAETGSVHVSGVFEFEKGSEAIALGAEVYYNETSGQITTTSSSATKAGFAVEAAAAGDAKVLVKINA